MKVIINADDFGYNQDCNQAIIDLFSEGYILSSSIMTDFLGSNDALIYAKNHKNFSFGLHFNLVEQGQFSQDFSYADELKIFQSLNPYKQRYILINGILNIELIKQEFIRQLSILFDSGINVSHVDSHGHIHKFPHVIKSILPIMKKFGISKIRRPENVYHKFLYPQRILNPLFHKNFKHIITTEFFYGSTYKSMSNEKLFRFLSAKSNIDKVLELSVHPGSQENWRIFEVSEIKRLFNLIRHDETLELISYHEL
jgi:predicted glycoside hydrolase/deacetylase ChbG (UPF0249 family)